MIEAMNFMKAPGRGRLAVEAIAVGVATAAWLLPIAASLALGWDEGFTFDRIDDLEIWFDRVVQSRPTELPDRFRARELQEFWHFSREEPDGHGPFYALLSMVGWRWTDAWLGPPLSYRIAGVLFFALAAGVLYATLRRPWGATAALLAVGLAATSPRLAPEISFALIDGPLVSLSLLAFCGFLRSVENRSTTAAIGFGAAVGAAMANKLTGWFLPLPFLAWTALYRDGRGLRTLAVGAATALIVCFSLNVGWWPDPLAGIERYFHSNLTRAETRPIPILFLGERYGFSLPWYNTLAWTVLATPVGALLFGGIGAIASAARWRREPVAVLALLIWGLVLLLRALPQAPGHDGTRQLAISFAFLPILAGYGALALGRWVGRWTRPAIAARAVALLGAAALLESAGSTLCYHPHELSYYSPLVGGLPGAARLGMEPTYFWDSLTPEVIDWIHANTPEGQWVMFRHNPRSLDHLERWGRLKVGHLPAPGQGAPRWLVMQHRPGLYEPFDQWLLKHGRPAYRKELFGVPLLDVYPYEQFAEARRRAPADGKTRDSP